MSSILIRSRQARLTRLYNRATTAHDMVTRLVADLTAEEGAGSAMGAQASLSELCLQLESLREESE
jgi:hypothetical protein